MLFADQIYSTHHRTHHCLIPRQAWQGMPNHSIYQRWDTTAFLESSRYSCVNRSPMVSVMQKGCHHIFSVVPLLIQQFVFSLYYYLILRVRLLYHSVLTIQITFDNHYQSKQFSAHHRILHAVLPPDLLGMEQ